MRPRSHTPAFSLVEAIIAAAIFATAVTVVISLLPSLARRGGESSDMLAAQRLPDALKVELQRLSGSGFDALAGRIPEISGPLAAGLDFAASRDALRLEPLSYLQPVADRWAVEEQYFLIQCWRLPAEPLRFDTGKAFLALLVRVSWPYRLPGAAAPTQVGTRSELVFTLVLNR